MKRIEPPAERVDMNSPEYWERIRAGLPIRPPKFSAGQWVWSQWDQTNVQLLDIYWDSGGRTGLRSFYRAVIPGWSGEECNIGDERPDRPRLVYERESGGYRAVRCDLPHK